MVATPSPPQQQDTSTWLLPTPQQHISRLCDPDLLTHTSQSVPSTVVSPAKLIDVRRAFATWLRTGLWRRKKDATLPFAIFHRRFSRYVLHHDVKGAEYLVRNARELRPLYSILFRHPKLKTWNLQWQKEKQHPLHIVGLAYIKPVSPPRRVVTQL